MTPEDIKHWKLIIDSMDHEKMVHNLRFLPAGHPIFVNDELYNYFNKRLDEFGGITPEISKLVGFSK